MVARFDFGKQMNGMTGNRRNILKKIIAATGILCLAFLMWGCGGSTPLALTTGDVTFHAEDTAGSLSSWDGVLTFATTEGITTVS